MTRARSNRLSFAKIPEVQEVPDLLGIQRESFEAFLESGLKQMFDEVSPIEDFTGNLALELTDHRFDAPPLSIEEAKDRDSNFSRPLFVTARFLNKETGEIKEQQVFLGDFPMMTANGTFIINGTERVVVSQLVRSPGVYFDETRDKASGRSVYSSKVIPGRGAWLEFDIDKKDTVGVRVDRLGNKSFDLSYSIQDAKTQIEHAVGSTVQVAYDYQSAKTIPIPDEWREIITRFEHLNL